MRIVLAPGPLAPEPHGVPLTGPDASGALTAGQVVRALAAGWQRARPGDCLVPVPLPDGGPGTAASLAAHLVTQRVTLSVPGALGDERAVDLVRLTSAGTAHGRVGTPSTWVLDAATLLALPADRSLAAREAREGSTAGLGILLARALEGVPDGDTLVVGLARSAVHDGGAGLVDALGGDQAARALFAGRDVLLALADDVPLGGMSGAGATLAEVTGLDPAMAQERDRAACAVATRLGREAARTGGAAVPGGVTPAVGSASAGPGRLSVTSWGTGAGGGAAFVLRALGARAQAGARVVAALTGLSDAVVGADLVVTALGEVFDVLADGVVAVAGEAALAEAVPTVLMSGRCAVPRGELAEAGVVSTYQLADAVVRGPAVGPGGWTDGGAGAVARRVEAMGERLARTWSR